MDNLLKTERECGREEVIARFGQGRLVQVSRTRVEPRGGSKDDEVEAVVWVALFLPEMVLHNRKPH